MSGISNFDIDDYYESDIRYQGCIAKDTLPHQIKPNSFYIINLDDSIGRGTHWTCIVNIKPKTCLYFDSYGMIAPTQVVKFMKTSKKQCYCNTVQVQSLNSDTCGLCCLYIIDQMKEDNKFLDIISQFGIDYYKNDEFLLSQFESKSDKTHHVGLKRHGGSLFSNLFNCFISARPRDNFSPAVRGLIMKYGDKFIHEIKVCRTPIESFLLSAMNWMTFGKLKQKMQQMNYDNMFHLYLLVKLNTGEYIRLEKNHVISMKLEYPRFNGVDIRDVIIPFGSKAITLNELILKAVEFRGPQIYIYDSVNANCQDFVLTLLRASNYIIDHSELYNFIKQRAEDIVPGYLKKINKFITDSASNFDIIMNGYGVIDNSRTNV